MDDSIDVEKGIIVAGEIVVESPCDSEQRPDIGSTIVEDASLDEKEV